MANGRQIPDIAQNLIEADQMERNSVVDMDSSNTGVPTWQSSTGVTMSHTGNTDYPNSHLRDDPMFNVPLDAIGTEKPFWWDSVDKDIQDAYLTDKQRAHQNLIDQQAQIDAQKAHYDSLRQRQMRGSMQQPGQMQQDQSYKMQQMQQMQQQEQSGGGKNAGGPPQFQPRGGADVAGAAQGGGKGGTGLQPGSVPVTGPPQMQQMNPTLPAGGGGGK